MAHQLRVVNGAADMAYVGETPWHGLGQRLRPGAPIEEWRIAAGMDYRICRSRVRFGDESNPKVWDDRHVLFRSDTKAPIAVVSDRYKIVQPAEVLDFFASLTSQQGMTLETAGVLFEGARYWALARLPLDFSLAGGDVVNGYTLLATSADGSIATTAQVTSVRVVCNNTLSLSMSEKAKHCVKVRHSTTFDANAVKVDLGLTAESWDEFRADAEALSRKRLSKATAVQILVEALSDIDALRAGKPIETLPNARVMGEIIALYNGKARGSQLASATSTAWGLVNACTEYFDHHAGRGQDSRLASSWFGENAKRKQKVLASALAA